MQMQKLTRQDLYTLEDYTERRADLRRDVMAHKKNRKVHLGPIATLYFEDRRTMHYQIQEMLRAERIFDKAGIEEELAAYNPLIPDGSNWKATFMIEVPDEQERRKQLAQLLGIEDRVWVRVGKMDPVFAIADEDMPRDTEIKTSSVHFMRFELSADMIKALRQDASLAMGIDHDHYKHSIDSVPENIRASLLADLD